MHAVFCMQRLRSLFVWLFHAIPKSHKPQRNTIKSYHINNTFTLSSSTTKYQLQQGQYTLVIMRVNRSSSLACVLLFSIKITVGIGKLLVHEQLLVKLPPSYYSNFHAGFDEFEQAQGNCTFLKIGHYRSNSITASVSIPSDSISCNGCYNDMFGNTSCLCISDMLQLLENCCPHNFTSMLAIEIHNQTLCKYTMSMQIHVCSSRPLMLYFSMQVY